LVFAAAPWAALVIWKGRALGVSAILPFLLVLMGLVFLKLSAAIFGLSLMGACLLGVGDRQVQLNYRRWIVSAVVLALFGLIFYVSWLSKGPTAVSIPGTGEAGRSLISLTFPVVGPLASIFSFTNFLDQLLTCTCRPGLPTPNLIIDLVSPFVAGVYVFVWSRMRQREGLAEYALFASTAAALFVAAFVVLYLKNSNIHIEDRHFRPVGLLLLPAVVHAFLSSNSRVLKGGLYAALALGVVYAGYNYIARERQNRTFAESPRGFRDDRASAQVLAFVRGRLGDKMERAGTLLYLQSPVLALEFPDVRRIVPMNGEDEAIEILAARRYRGHVRSTFLLLPKAMVENGKAKAVMGSFVDYDQSKWRRMDLDGYVWFFQDATA